MPIELPALPYADNALAPHISSNTIGFHYGKHHKAYVDNTNKLIAGTDLAEAKLEDIVKAAWGKPEKKGLFNNSAQVWNHTFYWNSLSPKSTSPSAQLKARIEADFGSFQKLRDDFANAAVTQFGSGWAWLVVDGGKLKLMQTANAETPLATGQHALLTVDVWEHAYYLDYQNRRPDYVATVLDKILNWEFASENFAKAGV
ncbi:MAG: superoxide dismutase [Vicinamibacteria bacterium]|nr:superoxide dismutase [Vicinamibacteria bacterium]